MSRRSPGSSAGSWSGPRSRRSKGRTTGGWTGLSERFTTLAGSAVPAAHPKTKVLGKEHRPSLALAWEWLLPEGIDEAEARRLNREQGARMVREAWPNIPSRALRNRTPLQAAAAGDAVAPLRAAVSILEASREDWAATFDFAALRERLKVGTEPAVDPASADLATLHAHRLAYVTTEPIADDALVVLYRRARQFGVVKAWERAAALLAERPQVREAAKVSLVALYSDLASFALARQGLDAALAWVDGGRAADAPATRPANAPLWDMLAVRLKMSADERPETWVPDLAVVLDRYAKDEAATQTVLLLLIEMGLVEVVPNPERRGEHFLDSRGLSELLSRYGPRVTTASGRLGVSAAKPEIWTPGAAAGGGGAGGVWTPGSGSAAPGAGPPGDAGKKLIIPGR